MDLAKKVIELEKRVVLVEKENMKLKNLVQNCTDNIIDVDQYIRRENVEVHNIPDSIQQNELERYIINIFDRIGVTISSYDIVACHRLVKRKNNKYAPVIVRVMNRKIAHAVMDNRHKLRYRHMPFEHIYFTENLTYTRRRIYNILYKMKALNKISSCGTKNGVPFFKDTENSKEIAKKVRTIEELKKYFIITDKT